MPNLIDSTYTRNRYEEIGFSLTDSQKATLIWNKPAITRQMRLSMLYELAQQTEDCRLRTQIDERIAYENNTMAQFQTGRHGEVLYVVLDDEDTFAPGYCGTYQMSLLYAQNCITSARAHARSTGCSIEKHRILSGGTLPLVRTSARVNPNLSDKPLGDLTKYRGEPLARLSLNQDAEIVSLWSNELSAEQAEKVDAFRRDRFESSFLPLPYVHRAGLCAKYLPTGKYGIIATAAEEWDRFLDRVRGGLYVDFSDTVLTVYFLTEQGFWSHEHCNPVYLEAETPEPDMHDPKQYAFCHAMEAMSAYLSGCRTEALEHLVIRTAQAFADTCEKQTADELRSKNAAHIQDILR